MYQPPIERTVNQIYEETLAQHIGAPAVEYLLKTNGGDGPFTQAAKQFLEQRKIGSNSEKGIVSVIAILESLFNAFRSSIKQN